MDNQQIIKNNKQIIDNYFTKNYPFILKTAKNCTYKHGLIEYVDQIISDCYNYLTLIKKEIPENKIEAYVVHYIYMQNQWSNSTINNERRKKIFSRYLYHEETTDITEFDYNEEEEKNNDIIRKLQLIDEFYETLSPDNQILFNLIYYKNINTSGKIQRYFAENGTILSRSTWYNSIKKLKIMLEEYIKNGNTN
jgi:hypothetical protein